VILVQPPMKEGQQIVHGIRCRRGGGVAEDLLRQMKKTPAVMGADLYGRGDGDASLASPLPQGAYDIRLLEVPTYLLSPLTEGVAYSTHMGA